MTTDGALLRAALHEMINRYEIAKTGRHGVGLSQAEARQLFGWLRSAAEQAEEVGADVWAVRFAAALTSQPDATDREVRSAGGESRYGRISHHDHLTGRAGSSPPEPRAATYTTEAT